MLFSFPTCAHSSLPDSEMGEDHRYSLGTGLEAGPEREGEGVERGAGEGRLGVRILSMDSGVCSLHNFRGTRPYNKAYILNKGKTLFVGRKKLRHYNDLWPSKGP